MEGIGWLITLAIGFIAGLTGMWAFLKSVTDEDDD